jgi:hypothetical protein
MTTTTALTLADCIDHLHPLPGPLLARIVVEGPASTSEDFLRLYSGRWEVLGGWNAGKGPGLPELLAANTWARVRFSPNLSIVANVSEMGPADVVTVRIPVPVAPPERLVSPAVGDNPNGFHSYDDFAGLRGAVGLHALEQKARNDEQRYDPGSAEGVLAKLHALAIPPSLVVNEHDAVVAMWRLSERVTEAASPAYKLNSENLPVPSNMNTTRFGLLHHRLAMRLGGDTLAAARPFMLLCDAPGIRRSDIKVGRIPGPVVTAEILHESTYTLESLEALVRG